MCGHSLQAHALSGGAAIKVLLGDCSIILCNIPDSVATIKVSDLLVWVYFNNSVVEPIKSAIDSIDS
jgi:hypothetical protein